MSAAVKNAPVTAGDLRQALLAKYSGEGRYGIAFEVSDGTGFQSNRRLDALVMHYWPSDGCKIIGIEMKVSRADFKRELDDAAKAETFARHCHEFAIMAPKGLVKAGELPRGWGLLEFTARGAQWALKPVTNQDVIAMPLPMQASVCRGFQTAERKRMLGEKASVTDVVTADLQQEISQLKAQVKDLQTQRSEGENRFYESQRALNLLTRRVHEAWVGAEHRWGSVTDKDIEVALEGIRRLRTKPEFLPGAFTRLIAARQEEIAALQSCMVKLQEIEVMAAEVTA